MASTSRRGVVGAEEADIGAGERAKERVAAEVDQKGVVFLASSLSFILKKSLIPVF
jgi:hypothetical protein